jgi:hypothetical protein
MKELADKYLNDLNLDIISQEELDEWYQGMIQVMPCSPIELADWEEHTGYMTKHIYIRDDEHSFGVLRTAVFYPDGTMDDPDVPCILIEEEY